MCSPVKFKDPLLFTSRTGLMGCSHALPPWSTHGPRPLLVLHESDRPGLFSWSGRENPCPGSAPGTLSPDRTDRWLSQHRSEGKAGHGQTKNSSLFYFSFLHKRTCCDEVTDGFLWEGRLRNDQCPRKQGIVLESGTCLVLGLSC